MTVTSTPAATSRKGRARTIRAGDDRESPLKYTRISYGAVGIIAGDDRESPLKYTLLVIVSALALAGDDRESPLKYTQRCALCSRPLAGDDRESPLKYTKSSGAELLNLRLGMTENRRSSTLPRLQDPDYRRLAAEIILQNSMICAGGYSGSRGFLP